MANADVCASKLREWPSMDLMYPCWIWEGPTWKFVFVKIIVAVSNSNVCVQKVLSYQTWLWAKCGTANNQDNHWCSVVSRREGKRAGCLHTLATYLRTKILCHHYMLEWNCPSLVWFVKPRNGWKMVPLYWVWMSMESKEPCNGGAKLWFQKYLMSWQDMPFFFSCVIGS